MKKLIFLFLTIFLVQCSSAFKNPIFKGPMPEPVGIHIENVKEYKDEVSFDAYFLVNLNTEKLTIRTKVTTKDSPKEENGVVKSFYFPKDVRKEAEEHVGVGYNFIVTKNLYSVEFIMDTFRGKPDGKNVLWQKKKTGSKTFTLGEILRIQ